MAERLNLQQEGRDVLVSRWLQARNLLVTYILPFARVNVMLMETKTLVISFVCFVCIVNRAVFRIELRAYNFSVA